MREFQEDHWPLCAACSTWRKQRPLFEDEVLGLPSTCAPSKRWDFMALTNPDYLEAWHIIDMANEVFGFGNWDAETVEMNRKYVPLQIPPTEEHPKGGIVVTYSARVRLTVYSQDGSRKVVRERSGGHRGFGPTVGQAIEVFASRQPKRMPPSAHS